MKAAEPIIILLVLMLSACVSRTVRSVPTGQIITVSETLAPDTVDMGALHSGERLSKTVSLRNDSSLPIAFVSTETSCGCLRLELPDEPLMPSATVAVELSFDSAGYRYWLPHTIELHTSLSDKPLKIIVTATIN